MVRCSEKPCHFPSSLPFSPLTLSVLFRQEMGGEVEGKMIPTEEPPFTDRATPLSTEKGMKIDKLGIESVFWITGYNKQRLSTDLKGKCSR